MPLTVQIITAERIVFSEEDVDEVVAPGVEGQFAVLPRHAAFITELVPGRMVLKKGGEEMPLAVTGGFFEVRDNRVTILADAAERAEEIDVARAEEARRRAQEHLRERAAGDMDAARMQAALQRAMARLQVAEYARRRREGRGPGRPGPTGGSAQ